MKAITYLLVLLFSTSLLAQDPMLQKPNESLDEMAKELTFEYNKHLGLNGEQIGLFEIKVEEFLIRRHKIEKQLDGREKLRALYTLQEQETKEMANVLTRPQMDVYIKVKPDIQPLELVEDK